MIRKESGMRSAWIVALAVVAMWAFSGCNGEDASRGADGVYSNINQDIFDSITAGMLYKDVLEKASNPMPNMDMPTGNGSVAFRSKDGKAYVVHFKEWIVTEKEIQSDKLLQGQP